MSSKPSLFALLLLATACRTEVISVPDGFCDPPDLAQSPVDLAPPTPKCAAAKGLAGDNLLCVDFKDVQTLSSLGGWSLFCGGSALWSTTGGMLQVNSFGTFDKECTALLPSINLNDPDKQKYKSLALSIVHRIDLLDPEQKVQIFLNDASDPTRLMFFATGKKTPSRSTAVYSLDRADFPAMLNNSPQWVLKVSSSAMSGTLRQGWQIESIAINGLP